MPNFGAHDPGETIGKLDHVLVVMGAQDAGASRKGDGVHAASLRWMNWAARQRNQSAVCPVRSATMSRQ